MFIALRINANPCNVMYAIVFNSENHCEIYTGTIFTGRLTYTSRRDRKVRPLPYLLGYRVCPTDAYIHPNTRSDINR
jgi:hypothetical protein